MNAHFTKIFLVSVAVIFASCGTISASKAPNSGQDVVAPGPAGSLAGTLIETDSDNPLVLIIPGSGPTDRDGNSPLGIKASSYRLLAEALEIENIATVRIDKRGMFGSDKAVTDPNDVTLGDYAKDVATWVSSMKEKTARDCLWLLGHSEGGLVALKAAQDETGICGVILVAAPGRKMGDILRGQLRANPVNAPILPQAMEAIDKIESGNRVDVSKLHSGLQGLFNPSVQGFLIDMFAADPAELIKTLKKPVLILQGDKDIQVSAADAKALAAANSKASLVIIEDMNHVLKEIDTPDRRKQMASYADENMPVHPLLAKEISQFVK